MRPRYVSGLLFECFECFRSVSKEEGAGWPRPPPVRGLAPKIKFLVNVTKCLESKFSDYMLVLCQKLHICMYDRQKFSGD